MKRLFSSVAILLIFTLFLAGQQAPTSAGADDRLARIKEFFRRHNAPVAGLAEEFLKAADTHGLDWRLLPSLALVESAGGRTARNNNIFGWNPARIHFATVEEGIYTVAKFLADGSFYKGKNLDQKLWTYNPVRGYRERVKAVMAELGERAAAIQHKH